MATISNHINYINAVKNLPMPIFNEQHSYLLDMDKIESKVFIESIFGKNPNIKEILVNGASLKRSHFYQDPTLWLREKKNIQTQEIVKTGSVSHPLREENYIGTHYMRYLHQINKTISFRTITLEDLDTFHNWHNQKRVAYYWELNEEKEVIKQYIQDGLNKKHQIPMIVELDGNPVGYFEFYWVKEDRLGPYYEARDYDRGFHFLIGDKRHLGKKNTDCIVQSALHFIYLDNMNTKFTMAEPRYDNEKVLSYAEDLIGWKALKVFDFPHKRAVLLQNDREIFFEGASL